MAVEKSLFRIENNAQKRKPNFSKNKIRLHHNHK